MSTLYLIRHGQGSFLAEDYDRLSGPGIEQSRRLGRYLASFEEPLDALYSGPQRRHLDTARHMVSAAQQAGFEHPEPQVIEGLGEFPFEAILESILPTLPEAERQDRGKVEAALQEATDRWFRGDLQQDGLESCGIFRTRVLSAFEQLLQREGRGRRLAVVTSGGPIAVIMASVLEMTPEAGWKQLWVLRNASLTELWYREDEITLVSFNGLPHLREKRLIIYH